MSAVSEEAIMDEHGRVTNGDGFDLLTLRPVHRLLHWSRFPAAFQTFFLAGFLFLLILGWGHTIPEGVPAKLYAKSNLVNLLIWGL